jgi:hypothetical protein
MSPHSPEMTNQILRDPGVMSASATSGAPGFEDATGINQMDNVLDNTVPSSDVGFGENDYIERPQNASYQNVSQPIGKLPSYVFCFFLYALFVSTVHKCLCLRKIPCRSGFQQVINTVVTGPAFSEFRTLVGWASMSPFACDFYFYPGHCHLFRESLQRNVTHRIQM